jgi:hypothetical protein
VLLAALWAVWSLTPDRHWGGRPGQLEHARPLGVLASFGRLLPPVGLLVGIYLFWIGADAPGGAFQAATIVTAVIILAIMAGLIDAPPVSSVALRLLIVAGPLIFVAVGLVGEFHGAFLTLPPGGAKALVLIIEGGLTFSLAAVLALLVMGPPRRAA